jgi:BNR/Asp-box repeat
VAALVGGCGGGAASSEPSGDNALVDSSADPPYIGALDVNPGDGSLLLATNSALWRVSRDGRRVERQRARMGANDVSAGLTLRFTGPDELVGSGHPGYERSDVPILGLIRSSDGGRTWKPVARQGESDFHSLAVSGDTIAAGEGSEATVYATDDGGRSFVSRATPLALLDLEMDPGSESHWIASAENGLFTSDDGGETWRPRETLPNIRLVWPASGSLLRVDPDGVVRRSGDSGETWEEVGRVEGETQALAAAGPRTLYAADVEGVIRVSRDGGRTWSRFTRP